MIMMMIIAMTPGEIWVQSLGSAEWATALDYNYAASEESVYATGLLPPPVFTGGYALSPVETRNGPVQGFAGISQQIPWPGYLGALREAAEARNSVSFINLRKEILSRRTVITGLWADSYRAAELARIAGERENLLASLQISAGSSVSSLMSRSASLADLRIKTELAALEYENQTNLVGVSVNRLEAYAGVPVSSLGDLPETSWFTSRIDGAETDPPSISAAELRVVEAQAGIRVAAEDRMPDITAGFSYSFVGDPEIEGGAVEPGRDSWMISVGLGFPLGYSGFSERQNAAEYRLLSAEAERASVQAETDARLEVLAVTIGNLTAEVELLEEMVLLAETAVHSSAAEWISGRGSYGSLVTSMQTELDIKNKIVERKAQLITSTAIWLEIAGAETEEGDFI